MPASKLPTLLTAVEVAAHFRVARETIYKWMRREGFPKPIKAGNRSLWDETDVAIWAMKRKGVGAPRGRAAKASTSRAQAA